MSDAPAFTIQCDGGCGQQMQTTRVTVLWAVTTCPDCAAKREKATT